MKSDTDVITIKTSLVILVLILLLAGPTFAQKRSDREEGGFVGQVQKVHVRVARLVNVSGKSIEGPHIISHTLLYDAERRLLESASFLPGDIPDRRATSKYDARGNEIEYASYVHDSLMFKWTASYDAKDRIIQRIYSNGSKSTCTYNSGGKRGICSRYNRRSSLEHKMVITYDVRGNEVEKIEYRADGSRNGRYVYAYDVNGNKIEETHYYKYEGSDHSSKSTFVYDVRGNVIEEAVYLDGTLSSKESHSYDDKRRLDEAIKYNDDGSIEEQTKLNYNDLDSRGNWTRATLLRWVTKDGESVFEPAMVFHRTITYFGSQTAFANGSN